MRWTAKEGHGIRSQAHAPREMSSMAQGDFLLGPCSKVVEARGNPSRPPLYPCPTWTLLLLLVVTPKKIIQLLLVI